MKKGLASYVIKNSKRYYHPANPKKLIEILETKKKKINSIMPQLQNLHQDQEPFKIEVYEGKQGLKTFYQDIINNTGEILAFGVTGMAFEILNFEFPHIVKQGIKNKIKIRYLANKDSKKQLNKIPKQILKVKYLSEKYNAKVSTIIYSNKVAIQSLQKDRIYISVIKDKNLYESYKNYFEFMWNSAN